MVCFMKGLGLLANQLQLQLCEHIKRPLLHILGQQERQRSYEVYKSIETLLHKLLHSNWQPIATESTIWQLESFCKWVQYAVGSKCCTLTTCTQCKEGSKDKFHEVSYQVYRPTMGESNDSPETVAEGSVHCTTFHWELHRRTQRVRAHMAGFSPAYL